MCLILSAVVGNQREINAEIGQLGPVVELESDISRWRFEDGKAVKKGLWINRDNSALRTINNPMLLAYKGQEK